MPKTETFDRNQVLEKITNLFWEKGYNGTSMQEIVDESGLNRSSLYNSFGDKYQLFNATISYYQEHVQDPAFEVLSTLPPKEALRELFEGELFAFNEKQNQKGCFLANCTTELAGSDKHLYRRLHSNMKETVELLSQVLERGIKSGEFKKDLHVRETALFLFSSIQGMRVTGMLLNSEEDLKGLIDRTLENI